MDALISKHIEISPGICGGQARIAGHRIRVQDIVIWHERMGQSADTIVTRFPQLTHADVHAALTYYFEHAAEINDEIRRGHELAEKMESESTSKLKVKLAKQHGEQDQVSS